MKLLRWEGKITQALSALPSRVVSSREVTAVTGCQPKGDDITTILQRLSMALEWRPLDDDASSGTWLVVRKVLWSIKK